MSFSDVEKRQSTDSDAAYEQPTGFSTGAYNVGDDNSSANEHGVHRVFTAGDNDEYVVIGRRKFLKDDLFQAFGGTLNPGLAPPSEHKFANPAPLGLSGFALTTFVLSMIKAKAQGLTIPNVVVGPAMFYGGIVQVIAGVWELALENTFGGTALCSYGGFWMSFSALYIPWFGIVDAYKDDQDQLGNAVGIYLLGWAIFTYGLSVCTMKSTLMFFALYFLLGTTFLLLAIGSITDNFGVNRAGGVLGIIVAFIAWYNAFAGLANKRNSYVQCKAIPLPNNDWHFGRMVHHRR
ncbi:ZYRO0E04180p [Zygosaccharomyces rouxii]|uniref:ZYRO0E04180p n=2 Tax=Zygosaccharomyces rouxii TaxID=4956 RepID=C5E4A1_ZYGRC|nr:uncharacterized protein ZYRO0E04180g [Zygosaccharomyces rouxii]KAH9198281.1 GPR1/FUN34/yaaH family-domain-containing protein [Zygosaccharomyces rouxii]CAQ43457.1 Protein FUN34 and Uncharacterized protein YCR010C [Zygosaccharomyces rouxii]CAR30862.1 ZYRO0E04180p [Zygosaccharomyces rouxii]